MPSALLESPRPMSSHEFALTVPGDRTYRELAVELTARYVGTLGVPSDEHAAFRKAFAATLDEVADGTADIHVSADSRATGLEVIVTSANRSSSVRVSVPSDKS
jgi:hypothetical protein